jgi:ketosteroid isomerase-like protein
MDAKARQRAVEWLEQFAACVRERRYGEARAQFCDGVLGFGTRVHSVVGLAALEQQQWRAIWERSADFRFDLSSLHLFGAGDTLSIAVLWTSTGYDAGGVPFQRSGRATLVLVSEGERLLAAHTHFSLTPVPSGP